MRYLGRRRAGPSTYRPVDVLASCIYNFAPPLAPCPLNVVVSNTRSNALRLSEEKVDMMTAPTLRPFGALWSCEAVLDQARDLLRDAGQQPRASDRFRLAHLAALRATAALLSAYSEPGQRVARRPTSAWVLLTKMLPPLAPWAEYFAAGAPRRAAADAGIFTTVTEADSLELTAAVQTFLDLCSLLIPLAVSGAAPELVRIPDPPQRLAAAMSRAS